MLKSDQTPKGGVRRVPLRKIYIINIVRICLKEVFRGKWNQFGPIHTAPAVFQQETETKQNYSSN